MTTKQYSEPQVMQLGDAVKVTLRVLPFGRREFIRRRRLIPDLPFPLPLPPLPF